MVSILLLPTLWSVLFGVSFYFLGFTRAVFILFCVLYSGYLAASLRPLGSLISTMSRLSRIVPKEVRAQRANLKERLMKVVNRLADPKMVRLFYSNEVVAENKGP
jgi:hypothetical protein